MNKDEQSLRIIWNNKIILLEGKEQEKNVCLQFSNAMINLQASRKHKYLSCEDIDSGVQNHKNTILRASLALPFL